jgi:hypothetical protein
MGAGLETKGRGQGQSFLLTLRFAFVEPLDCYIVAGDLKAAYAVKE